MQNNAVTVIGSYNVGLFFKGDVFPSVGETVISNNFHESGGGKGSNQAIACARMGVPTRFVCKIGSDIYGEDALNMYKCFGIGTKDITIDINSHTGMSVILIDKNGQNMISVVPGANLKLSREDIDVAVRHLEGSHIAGFQLENSLDTVEYGIKKVFSMGIRTLLDPAPAVKLPVNLYPSIYYIKPNEHEASTLTGIKVNDYESAKKAGEWFIEKGVNTAIITLGSKGAVLVTANSSEYFPAPAVKAIDTTGAGDCFSGVLMAALAMDMSIDEAIVFANHAAALSVSKLGVIEAIPEFSEVMASMGNMEKSL